nr:PREDICTED: thioredoxin O1, mitochondrial-like isoform X1 [Daucus carota subsp. sativus]
MEILNTEILLHKMQKLKVAVSVFQCHLAGLMLVCTLQYLFLVACSILFSCNSASSSNIVVVESEEQFKRSLSKVQDESQSAIFYYTAVWCSPCRLLSPIIKQMSEKYPHVTTYKVDIDHKGLGNALSNMDIHSVPTVHFFRNGIKANEVIGADVQLLKNIMEKLYK